MLSVLHVRTAEWVDKLDQTPGGRVWFNFRETRLTYQKSYLARDCQPGFSVFVAA